MKATLNAAPMGDEYSTMMRDAIRSRRSQREGAAPYTRQINTQAYTNAMADVNRVARGSSGGAVATQGALPVTTTRRVRSRFGSTLGGLAGGLMGAGPFDVGSIGVGRYLGGGFRS